MLIKDVSFVKGATTEKQFPQDMLPEVAFGGRSNVGKSSLINMLLGRRNLVRVSSTPGRTQQINFFLINQAFHLVDLPGYGFAKAPKQVRLGWWRMIESYIMTRQQLQAVTLLFDIRRMPNQEDLEALELFREAGVPVMIALTKGDKLPLQQRNKQVTSIMKRLNLQPGDGHVTSAQKAWGKDPLWNVLECFVTPLTNPFGGEET